MKRLYVFSARLLFTANVLGQDHSEGLVMGTKAPSLTRKKQNGNAANLQNLLKMRGTMLFYRGLKLHGYFYLMFFLTELTKRYINLNCRIK